MGDGSATFDERALTAALSEALRRGSFRDTYNRFRTGLRLHADKLTHLSAPHVGDIVNKSGFISQMDLERIREIEALVSEESTSVFALPKLLAFTRDRAPTPLFQDLADLAARIDPASVDPADVAGMVNIYLESRSFEDPLGAAFMRFPEAVDACLLPAIHLTDRGYFVVAPGGGVDIKTSVQAGIALESLGSYENNELYLTIGRALVSSGLLLSEQEAFLPERLTLDRRKVVDTTGSLYPEEIYRLVAGDRYYPKYVSLAADLGNGAWAWTSAENFRAERNGSAVRLSFDYPVDGTHHFIVRGIEPFSFMTFFGIRWVSDPQFQMYGSGWLYDAAEETLYVKITHTKSREELVISY